MHWISLGRGTQLVVVECLAPGNECESRESLRLELEGQIEVLVVVSGAGGDGCTDSTTVPARWRKRQMVRRLWLSIFSAAGLGDCLTNRPKNQHGAG